MSNDSIKIYQNDFPQIVSLTSKINASSIISETDEMSHMAVDFDFKMFFSV